MSFLEKFFHRKHGREKDPRVRYQTDEKDRTSDECVMLNLSERAADIKTASEHVGDVSSEHVCNRSSEHVDDLSDAAVTEPRDDVITQPAVTNNQAAPESTVTSSDRVIRDTGQVVHDEFDAIVAEPAVFDAAVEQGAVSAAIVAETATSGAEAVVVTTEVIAEHETNTKDAEQTAAADGAQCDIFIITTDDNEDNASKLADVFTKFCKYCSSHNVTIHPPLEYGENKLDHLRSGLASSSYRFIFIDDGFHEDDLVKFGTDAALMEMISRRDQSIIPVRAHANIVIPSLLRMFRSLDVHKLLRGKRLDDVDISQLTESDIEMTLLAKIIKMVSKPVFGSSTKLEQSPKTSPQHSEILRKHYSYLVDNMDPDNGLLNDLFSTGVISARQMESIRVEKTYFDRNECLIKMLMRKSEKDFSKFVEVLQVEQSHIATILCPS